jgi:hypothetical protein
LFADQQHPVDAKAWRLGFKDALDRRWWRRLRALVNSAFVLLAQRAFALLLALLFYEGLGVVGDCCASASNGPVAIAAANKLRFKSDSLFLLQVRAVIYRGISPSQKIDRNHQTQTQTQTQ